MPIYFKLGCVAVGLGFVAWVFALLAHIKWRKTMKLVLKELERLEKETRQCEK